MKHKITLLTVLILCIVATVVYIAGSTHKSKYVPQQRVSIIPGWNVYSNDTYKFAVDYPPNWNYIETERKNGATFGPANVDNLSSGESIFVQEGGRAGSQCQIPFQDYLYEFGEAIENYEKVHSIQEVSTQTGLTGYTLRMLFLDRDTQYTSSKLSGPYTFFEDNRVPCSQNEGYIVLTHGTEQHLELYNQMVSSLRFY